MKNLIKAAAALLAVVTLANCSGSGSSDGGSTISNLTISGKLNTNSSSAMRMSNGQNAAMAVSLTDLEIYAIAFTSPPVIAEADVGSDGSFTVNLPGAHGASVTAVFRDKTNNNEVGTVVFKDTSKKDLSGNAKESSSIVLGSSVALGDITLGDDGKVTIDVATIVSANPNAIVAAPTSGLFDMSGIWAASSFSPLPTGYVSTCAAGTSMDDCEGLPEGAQIALIRYAGKLFTPNAGQCDIDADPVVCDATSNGTVGTDDRYALSVWDASGLASCGYKTGFTEAEARAGGLLHLTSLPVVGQQMGFGSMTGYNPYFWLKQAATTQWPISDCKGVNVTVGSSQVPGYACKSDILLNADNSDTGDGWNVGLNNGGCFDTTTLKPVMVNNWGSLNPSNCTHSSDGLPSGFSKGTCDYSGDPDGSGPLSSTTFQCVWTNGQFADNAGSPNYSSPINTSTHHLGPPKELVAANGPCGIAGDGDPTGLTLQKAQCAANYYYQNQSSISATCGPKPRFNWSATTLEQFYQVDYKQKPDAMFLLDILNYDASGAVGTLDTEERETFTLPSGDDSSITCEVARKIVFNVRKKSDTTAEVEIRFSGRMASTAAACQGVAKQAMANIEYNKTVPDNQKRRAVNNADLEHILAPQAMLFNMTKQ